MIQQRLKELSITLPDTPAPPAGSYVPCVIVDNMLYISGQIPLKDGKIKYTGKVSDSNISDAQESAHLCAINILAQAKAKLKDLEHITRIVSLSGFVNSEPNFTQHPKVINAASDMLVNIFGMQKGSHSRIAIGVASLPLDAMTEIGAVIQIKANVLQT